ncbi:hypothetical protein O181_041583 [Austropuccinia psidii MF-1]|uniref:Integrase zinc-binding domain-containing protein n=1 Tax=Austropuccinia psidii MF-1 TaxID=1389203 RepID=A0A9Q3DJF7_9BASI|nr:hypothetical protein [Austropuccinia psidii MF-1]
MGGYDERQQDITTRALTTFETPLGRLQLTRLPQGETKSVAFYKAQTTWILQEQIPDHLAIFIDDGGIKGPSMPDGLSIRPKGEDKEESERDDCDEEEDWIKPHPRFDLKEVNTSEVGKLSRNKRNIEIPIKQEGSGKHMQEYLNTLQKPQSIEEEYFNKIKRRSVNFYLKGGHLIRINQEHPQIAVYNEKAQKQILKKMHEGLGHRGENETYRRIKTRYWWEGMKNIVKKWVRSCQKCQKRSKLQQKEEAQISVTSTLFERVSKDVVQINAGRWKYLVIARDDFSGLPETVALTRLTAK